MFQQILSINQYIYNAPWYRCACYSADYAEAKRNVLSRVLNVLTTLLQLAIIFKELPTQFTQQPTHNCATFNVRLLATKTAKAISFN